ncbi:hypothetical protein KIPB_002447 [Kipferlia bialata]|uniref:Uncharacterized protein n=1 Tax=Kipferlia bialata TaxID=797122 RepID=A0A9K3CTU4_9EUKA|nr:hypothetical protein KIPB_002447 [Kipferlia bialata]|eukprot:g2447.t1
MNTNTLPPQVVSEYSDPPSRYALDDIFTMFLGGIMDPDFDLSPTDSAEAIQYYLNIISSIEGASITEAEVAAAREALVRYLTEAQTHSAKEDAPTAASSVSSTSSASEYSVLSSITDRMLPEFHDHSSHTYVNFDTDELALTLDGQVLVNMVNAAEYTISKEVIDSLETDGYTLSDRDRLAMFSVAADHMGLLSTEAMDWSASYAVAEYTSDNRDTFYARVAALINEYRGTAYTAAEAEAEYGGEVMDTSWVDWNFMVGYVNSCRHFIYASSPVLSSLEDDDALPLWQLDTAIDAESTSVTVSLSGCMGPTEGEGEGVGVGRACDMSMFQMVADAVAGVTDSQHVSLSLYGRARDEALTSMSAEVLVELVTVLGVTLDSEAGTMTLSLDRPHPVDFYGAYVAGWPVFPPDDWTCPAQWYSLDNICDTSCGAFDPDCVMDTGFMCNGVSTEEVTYIADDGSHGTPGECVPMYAHPMYISQPLLVDSGVFNAGIVSALTDDGTDAYTVASASMPCPGDTVRGGSPVMVGGVAVCGGAPDGVVTRLQWEEDTLAVDTEGWTDTFTVTVSDDRVGVDADLPVGAGLTLQSLSSLSGDITAEATGIRAKYLSSYTLPGVIVTQVTVHPDDAALLSKFQGTLLHVDRDSDEGLIVLMCQDLDGVPISEEECQEQADAWEVDSAYVVMSGISSEPLLVTVTATPHVVTVPFAVEVGRPVHGAVVRVFVKQLEASDFPEAEADIQALKANTYAKVGTYQLTDLDYFSVRGVQAISPSSASATEGVAGDAEWYLRYFTDADMTDPAVLPVEVTVVEARLPFLPSGASPALHNNDNPLTDYLWVHSLIYAEEVVPNLAQTVSAGAMDAQDNTDYRYSMCDTCLCIAPGTQDPDATSVTGDTRIWQYADPCCGWPTDRTATLDSSYTVYSYDMSTHEYTTHENSPGTDSLVYCDPTDWTVKYTSEEGMEAINEEMQPVWRDMGFPLTTQSPPVLPLDNSVMSPVQMYWVAPYMASLTWDGMGEEQYTSNNRQSEDVQPAELMGDIFGFSQPNTLSSIGELVEADSSEDTSLGLTLDTETYTYTPADSETDDTSEVLSPREGRDFTAGKVEDAGWWKVQDSPEWPQDESGVVPTDRYSDGGLDFMAESRRFRSSLSLPVTNVWGVERDESEGTPNTQSVAVTCHFPLKDSDVSSAQYFSEGVKRTPHSWVDAGDHVVSVPLLADVFGMPEGSDVSPMLSSLVAGAYYADFPTFAFDASLELNLPDTQALIDSHGYSEYAPSFPWYKTPDMDTASPLYVYDGITDTPLVWDLASVGGGRGDILLQSKLPMFPGLGYHLEVSVSIVPTYLSGILPLVPTQIDHYTLATAYTASTFEAPSANTGVVYISVTLDDTLQQVVVPYSVLSLISDIGSAAGYSALGLGLLTVWVYMVDVVTQRNKEKRPEHRTNPLMEVINGVPI